MIRSLLCAVLFVTAFTFSGPALSQDSPQTLTVFAAASLTNAFEEIAQAFEAAHPGVDVVFNFAGSSTLAAQLAEGSPADVFASANYAQLAAARAAGRISGRAPIFARNQLALIVPADNPANIQSLDDLANPGLQLVLAAPGVPVRTYTDVMLERMASDPAYGEAYRSAVLANLASEEDNVRQVAAKVALGEADAGIVYVSDVTPEIRDQVLVLPIPTAFNSRAAYPMALTNDTANRELAQAFMAAVLSDEGQRVLESWGFVRASGGDRP